jgi:hypothetical protein
MLHYFKHRARHLRPTHSQSLILFPFIAIVMTTTTTTTIVAMRIP